VCVSISHPGRLRRAAEHHPGVGSSPATALGGSGTAHAGLFAAPPPAAALAERYRDASKRIIAAARKDRGAYAKLETLTDRVGHRLSGSPELDRAIEWAQHAFAEDGHASHTERVMVPHWVRGAESAELVEPLQKPLFMLGLGGSILGILLSFGTRWVLHVFVPASLPQAIVPEWWPIAGVVAVGAALLGALFPGMIAVRQDPIEALSYE